MLDRTLRAALNASSAAGGLFAFDPCGANDLRPLRVLFGEQFAELYYKKVLTPNFQLSLIGQGTFSRTVAMSSGDAIDPTIIDPITGLPGNPALNDALPNAWMAGVRTVFSY